MTLKVFSGSERAEYEEFVAAHGGSFLQSWNWGEFQSKLNQKIIRVGLQNGNSKISAQFMEQTIPHLGGKYLYCPYGPIGDLVLIPKLVKLLNQELPGYWFVRLEPQNEFGDAGQITLRIQPGKTLITDLTKTQDELLAGMHNKTRYNIKVAQKHNVSVEKISDPAEIDSALKLISETSARQGFTDHPASYYQSLMKHLPEAHIYVAKKNGDLLNSAVMIDYQETRTYLFGGSSAENKNLMGPYLLHWQAMQDAKVDGKKYYDWWGIETATGKTPGFTRFKLGWPGEQISYPQPVDMVNKPAHYLLYKLLRSLNRLF